MNVCFTFISFIARKSPKKEYSAVQPSEQSKHEAAFKKAWAEVMKTVNSVNDQVNSQLFEKLNSFCRAHLQITEYIPAASVITGNKATNLKTELLSFKAHC